MKKSTARLFLELRGVEQGGDNRGRPNTDRNSGLYQLRSALVASPVVILVRIAHRAFSMAFDSALEAT